MHWCIHVCQECIYGRNCKVLSKVWHYFIFIKSAVSIKSMGSICNSRLDQKWTLSLNKKDLLNMQRLGGQPEYPFGRIFASRKLDGAYHAEYTVCNYVLKDYYTCSHANTWSCILTTVSALLHKNCSSKWFVISVPISFTIRMIFWDYLWLLGVNSKGTKHFPLFGRIHCNMFSRGFVPPPS